MSSDPRKVCQHCQGERYIERPARGSWEEHGTVYAPCPKCNDIYGRHLRRVLEDKRV